MTDTPPLSEKHLQARALFDDALARERFLLADGLQQSGVRIDNSAPLGTLLAVARHSDDPGVSLLLEQFETAIRGPLEAYAASTPKRDRSRLNASGRLLVTHFRDYTEVPITPTWIQRVVIWAHRTYRAWRR